MNESLNAIFRDFGDERIAEGSHLEKVCLIQDGVGRDCISDFTANLIKEYLLEYTQEFCRKHIRPEFRKVVAVPNAYFDYDKQVWCCKKYELPFAAGDYVVLTPRELLTRDDNWINRHDLFGRFEEMVQAVPDQQLRAQVNQYLIRQLKEDCDKSGSRQGV